MKTVYHLSITCHFPSLSIIYIFQKTIVSRNMIFHIFSLPKPGPYTTYKYSIIINYPYNWYVSSMHAVVSTNQQGFGCCVYELHCIVCWGGWCCINMACRNTGSTTIHLFHRLASSVWGEREKEGERERRGEGERERGEVERRGRWRDRRRKRTEQGKIMKGDKIWVY